MEFNMNNIVELSSIYDKLQSQSLPFKTTYKLLKLFNAIKEDARFYGDGLNSLLDTYGEKDSNGMLIPANGGGIKLRQDSLDEFQLKLEELQSVKVEVPDIKFSLNELEDFNLSVNEFNLLMPFIEE